MKFYHALIVLIFKGIFINNFSILILYNNFSFIACFNINYDYETNIPTYERQALYDLYNSTNGNDWTYQEGNKGYWNFTDPNVNPCLPNNTWQGLNCTTNSTTNFYYISKIMLSEYNLDGTIPASIGSFSELLDLNVSTNHIIKNIPNTIGNLSNLTKLDLSNNLLSGTLPNNIYKLSNLQVLNLDSNHNLIGTISNFIGNLSRLEYFNVRYNLFRGTIPYKIGSLSRLTYLRLSGNYFESEIPDSLRNLKMLELLSLSSNKLNGSIPNWLGELTYLRYISLRLNYFTGTIPCSISSITSLFYFTISYNLIEGNIPSCIGKSTKLTYLNLGNNQLTGTIPNSLSELTIIKELHLNDNLLIGSAADILNDLNSLITIEVQNNYLTGTLPSLMSHFPNLTRCFLQNNHLSGNLKYVFDGNYQKQLNNIQLSNNQFTGELPEELFISQSLVSFSAVSNCFHGSIPDSICLNTELETLALDGLVCASSCSKKIIPGISSAYISDNEITGGIPNCLWSMPKLQVLHLSGNSIKGSLSDDIELAFGLKDISLSYNILTGTIPNFPQDKQWTSLDLSHNHLSGTLRSNHANQLTNISLSLKNNRLSGTIPNTLYHLEDISILEGGFYDCKYDRNDLPQHDEYKNNYKCGSNAFNILYYIWLGLFFIIIIVIVYAWYNRKQIDNYMKLSIMTEKIWNWINVMNYLKTHYEIENISVENQNKMIQFQKYTTILGIIVSFSAYCTLFIIIILVPLYLIITTYYQTHTYLYAWTLSILYLSGRVATGVNMSALILFILMQVYLFCYVYKIYDGKDQQNKEYNDDKLAYEATSKWKIYNIYISYTLLNLIVVIGVNIAYAYVVLYQSNSLVILAQFLLSNFKMVWNNIICPKLARAMINYLTIILNTTNRVILGRIFLMQYILSLFNNIIIPCIVIAMISPNCFYHIFQQESDVSSSFIYQDCVASDRNDVCIEYTTIEVTTSYTPPFIYSYECTSDFITYYAPVYTLMCIISTFIVPLIDISILKLSKYNNNLSMLHELPNLLKPITSNNISSPLINIDDIFEILVSLMNLTSLLLTFGAAFPPLAIVLLITICRRMLYHKALLGRYISNAINQKEYICLDIINEDCKAIPLLSTIQICAWFLLFVSCSFYALFLFEMLADNEGVSNAYWILIVMPCIPICMHFGYKLYVKWLDSHKMIIDNIAYFRSSSIIKNDNNNIEVELSSKISISNPLFTNIISECKTDKDDNRNIPIDEIYAEDRDGNSLTSQFNMELI